MILWSEVKLLSLHLPRDAFPSHNGLSQCAAVGLAPLSRTKAMSLSLLLGVEPASEEAAPSQMHNYGTEKQALKASGSRLAPTS